MGGGFACFKRETERECVEEDGKRIVKKKSRESNVVSLFFPSPRKDAYRLRKKTSINALRQNPI